MLPIKTILTIVLISIANCFHAQILNGEFENWNDTGSYKTLEVWDCDGDFLGACTQVEIGPNNFAVRMDNSLPCSTGDMSNPQFSNLGNGTLTQFFKVSGGEFYLSYDLVIDSIDMPATFNISLDSPEIGNILDLNYNEITNGTFHHVFNIDSSIDSIYVRMYPIGLKKDNGIHDCDRGYISALVDNIQVEKTVSTISVSNSNLEVYPNPSNGYINIKSLDQPLQRVELYDLLGNNLTIYELNNSDFTKINVEGLGDVILLRIIDANGKRTFRKIFMSS